MPQPTPYVPPTFSQPTVSNPISQNNQSNQNNQVTSIAPNTMNTVPNSMLPETGVATKMNEPSLVIPKDSQRSELPSPIPVAASVPAILPQHEELAKVEPPLGSQLQNQVRGIRNQESSETKLRFGSGSNATTGAVRYHPKSTVQNNADLIPSQPMPVDTADPVTNPLLALLPTGNPQPGAADSLPPLETAPQPVLATPNPAYQRSLSNDRPLSVQSTSVQSDSLPTTVTNNERRASLFRRMDEEIKRSPTTAEQYTVQQNDTYLTISDRFFGTSRLFRALAEYNRQKYGTDYKLLEGTVIEIPPADYLKTNYAEVLSRGRQRFEKSTTPNISSPGLRYIVQEGDTVFRIATNQLRDSTRWQEIVNMNSDKLRDPRDLQPGMEIILPAATATQNTYGRR
jgi:nucleoid-associated protein YgaU